MRRRVYEILTNPRQDDVVGRVVNGLILALIAANVVASLVETDVEIASRAPVFFDWFERISVIVFTVEYVLRLWSSTVDPEAGPLRQALRPMQLIDLAAIGPFYLQLLFPNIFDLRFLRILRLVRVFRVARSGKLVEAFGRLARVVMGKRTELLVSSSIVGIATIVSAGIMYLCERSMPNTQFTSIPRSMWWAIVTITTVGYGDITPQSGLGRVVGGIVSFVGICLLALPVGIISSGYVQEIQREKREPKVCKKCGHPVDDEHDG